MIAWPPRDVDAYEGWLLDDMPMMRERIPVLRDQLARVVEKSRCSVDEVFTEFPDLRTKYEALTESIERAEAKAHQPINVQYSQTNAVHSQHSDPTYSVVLTWLVRLPQLQKERWEMLARLTYEVDDIRSELGAAEGVLCQYEHAKAVLKEREREYVEMRYEQFLSAGDVCREMDLPATTYKRVRQRALSRMLQFIGGSQVNAKVEARCS